MMARKCSHCGHNGHNSRTCTTQRDFVGGSVGSCVGGGSSGVRLFGVQLYVASPPMNRSFSMDCISYSFQNSSSSSSPSSSPSTSSLVSIDEMPEKNSNGYLSDGLVARAQERKKGIPWTEEEHKLFLAGMERLGKGDWRGISRNFVTTRTPTQVASHAQKYFLRQNSLNKKKRRSSLFDVAPNSDQKPCEIDTPKLKEHSFSREMDAPMLSLNLASNGVIHTTAIDLVVQGEAQQTELPSHTCLVSNSSISQSSSLPERSYILHSPLDLKLSFSSSSTTELSNPSPSNNSLFLENIRVV